VAAERRGVVCSSFSSACFHWAKTIEDLHVGIVTNKVYRDQMNHVRKGCLARKRQDIRSDGSRIEGSHKGWNSLQRAQPSGLAVFVALGHDHVLRRNIRITTAGNKLSHASPFSSFDASTFGSHHTRLVNYTAKLWNSLWRLRKPGSSTGLLALPEMTVVSSDETFGLVTSECAMTFGGLFSEVKAEPKAEDSSLLTLDADEDLDLNLQDERRRVVDEFGIDTSLFNVPMVRATANPPSSQIASPATHAEDRTVPPNAEVARPIEQTRNGMTIVSDSVLCGSRVSTSHILVSSGLRYWLAQHNFAVFQQFTLEA
jgi:hypothetical protein